MRKIKNFFNKIGNIRLLIVGVIVLALFGLLIQRIFVLQIVKGESYQANYTLRIEREREVTASRGNIYDRNGKLLAYNELAYTISLEDNGTYVSTKDKNEALNSTLQSAISVIEKCGDSISNDFFIGYVDGSYEFLVDGTNRLRALADVYGAKTIEELKFDEKLGYNQAMASPQQVIDYLAYQKYDIPKDFSEHDKYEVALLRYALAQNYFRQYLSIEVASDVSDESVAAISEISEQLQGISVKESTIRKYVDSEYYSLITGYTGKISQDEYDELHNENENYTTNDIVGKSGIEKVMEQELQGTKGYEKLYVNNLGKVTQITDYVEATPGNDVYLSIDADLQGMVYRLLEQEIAGILEKKMTNTRYVEPSTIGSPTISTDEIFNALFENNVLNIDSISSSSAGPNEQKIYTAFTTKNGTVRKWLQEELTSSPTKFSDLSKENVEYINQVYGLLFSENYLLSTSIDKEDEVYKSWKLGDLSFKSFLNYAIKMNWIDITKLGSGGGNYLDSDEAYNALVNDIMDELATDNDLFKLMYKYMIRQNQISGTTICLALFEQDILAYNDDDIEKLENGTLSAYNFIKGKIHNLEISPAQLALDPCSGSCSIIDPNTGELLALVSYPGFDNNKLANGVDADYYSKLTQDLSSPFYNKATQEELAPGSTFKMVTASAGLTEGAISTTELIKDLGVFTKVDNEPKCWIYPGTHGSINVSEAIGVSCNYFFYEVGYRLSMKNGIYDDAVGIANIQKYASEYGLDRKTGIEIPESMPKVADQYPVMAAIGQSNHAYSTVQLARYVTGVANSGTIYDLTLLKSVNSNKGVELKSYNPTVSNTITTLDPSSWAAIHSGMAIVVSKLATFDSVAVNVAGKTGTAQQDLTRSNHALFVGFAPQEDPQMALAVRIPYGGSSGNAAEVSSLIIKYYFGEATKDELLTGTAGELESGYVGD